MKLTCGSAEWVDDQLGTTDVRHFEEDFGVRAPAERVWQLVTRPGTLMRCLPDTVVDGDAEDVVAGRIKVRVGLLTTTYRGTARWTHRDTGSRGLVVKAAGKQARGPCHAEVRLHLQVREEGPTRSRVYVGLVVVAGPVGAGPLDGGVDTSGLLHRFATGLARALDERTALPT